MRKINKHSFFLVIPTRERKEHLLNLLSDLEGFSEYISQCVIVDQSELFIGGDFDFEKYPYEIKLIKGIASKGVNHSRNIALEAYNNEDWLFFLDDDLRVEKQELDKIIFYLENYSYDVIVPGTNEKRQEIKTTSKYSSMLDQLCKPQSYDKVSNGITVSSGLTIVHKDVFAKAGGVFDEKFTFWGDDWDFGLRLYKAGATIKYVPDINFTHLEVPFGGQRSYSEKINRRKEKNFLEYYFIQKHFGVSVLNERFFLDILKNCRFLKFVNLIDDIRIYRKVRRYIK